MRDFIRPIPARSIARSITFREASYIQNTIEPRNPKGPKWLAWLLAKLHLELVEL